MIFTLSLFTICSSLFTLIFPKIPIIPLHNLPRCFPVAFQDHDLHSRSDNGIIQVPAHDIVLKERWDSSIFKQAFHHLRFPAGAGEDLYCRVVRFWIHCNRLQVSSCRLSGVQPGAIPISFGLQVSTIRLKSKILCSSVPQSFINILYQLPFNDLLMTVQAVLIQFQDIYPCR